MIQSQNTTEIKCCLRRNLKDEAQSWRGQEKCIKKPIPADGYSRTQPVIRNIPEKSHAMEHCGDIPPHAWL
ncbi:hypothetical protein SRHO_G00183320 [Serrasalmus rhombeus]